MILTMSSTLLPSRSYPLQTQESVKPDAVIIQIDPLPISSSSRNNPLSNRQSPPAKNDSQPTEVTKISDLEANIATYEKAWKLASLASSFSLVMTAYATEDSFFPKSLCSSITVGLSLTTLTYIANCFWLEREIRIIKIKEQANSNRLSNP